MSLCTVCGDPARDPCPKCGSCTAHGYGFAGGGFGLYRICNNLKCDYSENFGDPELEPELPQ